MPTINVLPKNIADLIAAGEVVERPSSVIKEFIENSVDAGSKSITVEIKCGGKTYIRVTDNGCGIEREDVRKAFLSHATSKIKEVSDLDSISTLGFRGEALASVCAVSKVELITRTTDSEIGTRYVIEGGEEILLDDAGCPVGTTLVVRDLFYNIPARMKFLKKDAQEGNYIATIAERIAVSHPEISLRFIRDGKLQFITPGDGELKSAVYAVFGKEFYESLLPISYEMNGIKIYGFTGKPSACRSSRSMQIFFVNQRFVKIPMFVSALEAAYKNSMLVGKFPGCVLFADMPYSVVDVNVHPAKTEVRFFDEKRIFECIYSAVIGALTADVARPKAVFSEAKAFMKPADKAEQLPLREPNYVSNTRYFDEPKAEPVPDGANEGKAPIFSVREYGNSVGSDKLLFNAPKEGEEKQLDFLADTYMKPVEKKFTLHISDENKPAVNTPIIEVDEDDTSKEISLSEKSEEFDEAVYEVPDFRLIGEAFKTYIIVETEGKMILIDKHAAHERIIFNRLKETKDEFFGQLLLQPVTVTLSDDGYSAVLDNVDLLLKAGYDISDFGDRCVKVSSCPAELVDENIADLITEISEYLSQNIKTVMPEKLDWIFHSSACRAAIKAGNDTTPEEMTELVKYLFRHNEIKCCPHGRPVVVELTKYELEKLFKRIV